MAMSDFNKERSNTIYKLLGQPWIYKFSEAILSPGNRGYLIQRIKTVIESFPNVKSYLDMGCGPNSWLSDLGLNAIGVDISLPYIVSHSRGGNPGVVASADHLPFAKESFDAVWTVGLLHHLTDSMFQSACSEMLRVCIPGGYIAIIDAVKPHSYWARPVPALLRKLDRGRYVRDQDRFERLIAPMGTWSIERYTYARNGLEAVSAIYAKR